MLDPVATERAEKSIDEFINARSKAREKANNEEEAWKEFTRRVNEKRRRENRTAWVEYYRQLALSHHVLAALNAERASALEEQGEGGLT